MPALPTYPPDASLNNADMLIGTDVSTGETVNFTLERLATFTRQGITPQSIGAAATVHQHAIADIFNLAGYLQQLEARLAALESGGPGPGPGPGPGIPNDALSDEDNVVLVDDAGRVLVSHTYNPS